METIGLMKHENLVPLMRYCSFGVEKVLVYDYMVNGSLDVWLRNRTQNRQVLDWHKRLKIATGVARGQAFLHHELIPHVIHRDLKSSNILVDKDFEPKIADFGLAWLISDCETHVSNDLAGTFGYIPPEYVQSRGLLLREMSLVLVTGKKPIGPEFKDIEGGNLVGWVNQKIKKVKNVDVLDPTVLHANSRQSMLQTLQIAAICLSGNLANRATMMLHVRDKIGS